MMGHKWLTINWSIEYDKDCGKGKYLRIGIYMKSSLDDLVVKCDEIVDILETLTRQQKYREKKDKESENKDKKRLKINRD